MTILVGRQLGAGGGGRLKQQQRREDRNQSHALVLVLSWEPDVVARPSQLRRLGQEVRQLLRVPRWKSPRLNFSLGPWALSSGLP